MERDGPITAETHPARGAFAALCAEVAACRRCPGMDGRRRVLSPLNGRPGAPVLFVAEAPGRRGADRTGVPLSGDRSGARFDALLAEAGLTRDEIFVTNAVLCNPRSADDRRNRPPSRDELAACADHLGRQIAVVDPLVVAPLGAVALAALDRLEPHALALGEAAGRPSPWYGRWLVPLYHPGDRALLHRPLDRQLADVRALRRFLDAEAAANGRAVSPRPGDTHAVG
jgi:uracil-DNA glycosylase family 4